MADDVMLALAFVARRQGRRSLPRAVWGHVLSLELGWMGPGEARAFVERAVTAGVLHEDGEELRLHADPARVEVPRGFRPDAGAVPAGPSAEDPFVAWAQKVAHTRGADLEVVLAEVAALQESMGGLLTAEAAVLVLARDAGLDVRGAAGEALERLKPTATKASG